MLKFLCLLALVAYTNAIVCTPNFCQMVRCAAVTAENCAGNIKNGGSMCGCCDSCITELMEGERCMDMLFLGIPPTTSCGQGLHCDPSTHTCVSDPGACELKLATMNSLSSASHLLGGSKPLCDTDGNYAGMQVSGSQAYCVTKDGTPIDSYSVNRWEAGDDMNCECARDLYTYMKSGLIGKLFYCEPNGNYPKTGAHTGAKRLTLSCTDRLAEVDAQYKAQPGLTGLERPHCDADGYLGMQYAGSQAYCVTKNGIAISGYMVNRWETGKDMNCQCARDEYDYKQTGLIGKTYSCERNGNYASVGCMGSVCYCQDKYGKQIATSTVSIGSQDSLNC